MKNVLILLIVLAIPWINVSGQGGFGPDQYICADGSPASIPCVENGDWWNYQLIESGDGYFDGYAPFMCPWALDYYPGPGDLQNGQVDFCLILYNNWGTIIFYDCITFFFIEPPIVYAGEDQNIQEGDVAFLEGEATNYSSILWLYYGDGFIEDCTSPETIYYPGLQDIQQGEVLLTLIAEPNEPCTMMVTDELTINIFTMGNSNFLGPDQMVCLDTDHINLPCEVGSGFWVDYDFICYGDGYFDGYAPFMCPWAFDYYPGFGDLANGYVEFCLTLYYDDYPYMESDCITYYFQPLPSAYAGDDFTVQPDEDIFLTGYAENFSSTLWSTDGDGSFLDSISLSTSYLPGTQDVLNGTVELCIIANPMTPCTVSIENCLMLTILSNPSQDLLLPQGWSGISFHLTPENPLIEDIFGDLGDNLVIMYSNDGIWWPQTGINTLGTWDINTSYVIKIEEDETLSVVGETLTNKTVSLQAGWNYLPVLSNAPVDCMQLFGSILDDVIIVKEIAGTKVFWPSGNINTLGSLQPGKGYLIKTDGEVSVTFP